MANKDTRYVIVDYENRETLFIEGEDNLLNQIEPIFREEWQDRRCEGDDVLYLEDMECEVYKVLATSTKRVQITYQLRPTMKISTA